MRTVYVVRAIAVRNDVGAVVGWVRADPLADGTRPTDAVFLRDGSACGQAEASKRIGRDPGLLYPSEADAVREGLAQLRAAEARRRHRRH